VLELLGRERSVRLTHQEPAVADDRRQRRAQLVAHHGEELALELVQPAQLLVDLGERPRLPLLGGIFRLVLVHHVSAFDEQRIAPVQREERHCRAGRQQVHGHDRGERARRCGRHRLQHRPHRRPPTDGNEDQRNRHAERFATSGRAPADLDDDERTDDERGNAQHDVRDAIDDLAHAHDDAS
jgi:hypothetical protein